MDPITTAIVAALVAGVTAGAADVGQKVIVDAYEGLKAVIKSKFGEQNELSTAITSLESKPESAGRQATLEEEVVEIQAEEDAEIMAKVQRLEELLSAKDDVRVQTILRSARSTQIMDGKGGQMEQKITDSTDSKQFMG